MKNYHKSQRPNYPIYLHITSAVAYLRWLVADLSPRRLGCAPGSAHVGFAVSLDNFSLSYSVIPCQYHFAMAPYSYRVNAIWGEE
jgi:hypothetical protein